MVVEEKLGIPTYFWQSSTTSNTGPWTTIGSSDATTYDPSTISQTTWYRRGYYRCDVSAAVYTDAVEMTVTTNPSSAGSIGNAQTNCNSFDPTTITNATSPTGGSTPLIYLWEYSTNSSTGPWTSIGSSNSSTYDPSTISQTTWYRRGVYGNGCSSSSAVYTTAVEMTIGGSEPNFGGQINGAEQQCTAFNPGNIISSIDGSGGSGGTPTYFWEYSTTSNTGPWTSISSSNNSSYDPPSIITQTTWYRRGYYRCDPSTAVYSTKCGTKDHFERQTLQPAHQEIPFVREIQERNYLLQPYQVLTTHGE